MTIAIIGSGNQAIRYATASSNLNIEYDIISNRNKADLSCINEFHSSRRILSFEEVSDFVFYDLIICSSRTEANLSAAHYLLDLGVKKILVEKPISFIFEDIKSLISKSVAYGANVMEVRNRRFLESVAYLKNISSTISSIRLDLSEEPSRIYSTHPSSSINNWLRSGSIHMLDLLCYLFDDYPKINYIFRKPPVLSQFTFDYFSCSLTYGTCEVCVLADFVGPGKWSLQAVCPDKRLILEPTEVLSIQPLGTFSVSQELTSSLSNTYEYMILDALLDDPQVLPSNVDILKTHTLIESLQSL